MSRHTATGGNLGRSSRTGLARVGGQRLGLLLGALCGPSSFTLHLGARHPSPIVRRMLDVTFALAGGSQRRGVDERRLSVTAADGTPLKARLFSPSDAGGGAPLLVYFPGGGFVLGSPDSHVNSCRLVARESGCHVLAIGYRKAPERRFPGPIEDCVAAFRWAVDHAGTLGVEPDRIAVGGDSAGANLAANVCLATAEDAVRPSAAWLLYPVADGDLTAWASGRTFVKGPLLSLACAEDMLGQYLTDAERADPRMTILAADRLDAMPPTYVATAGMDLLRDQGEAFAGRVHAAGVRASFRRFDALPHGFALLLVDRRAREATKEAARALTELIRYEHPTQDARVGVLVT
jgi:acetyl esterase